MTTNTVFKPKLIALMVHAALVCPLLWSPAVAAQQIVDKDRELNAGHPLDSYRVIGPATLTANNADILYIDVTAGGNVVLNDSRIVPGSSSSNGLLLDAGTALLQRTLIEARSTGLGGSKGSHATAVDSVIRAGSTGALLNQSRLDLIGSEVHGTNANGYGAKLFDATLVASDSLISGGRNGIQIRDGSGVADGSSTVMLENSHVQGLDGAAIAVGRGAGNPASAQIDILNRSTLTGSNGVLVEVAADANAAVRVNDSHLLGDIVVAEGGNAAVTLENAATLTGRLENVAELAINSGAAWTMVGDGQVGHLAMNGGTVQFGGPGEYVSLSLGSLEGNGTFAMAVDFANGQADFLDIVGNASGEHTLRVTSSGHELAGDQDVHMVHSGSGDAHFSLDGGPVDVGAYAYDLVRKGPGNDWYLDFSKRVISPGTQSVMALANATPTIWYGEQTTLRGRLGEVRRNGAQAGSWVRTYGNRYNVSNSAGAAYQQQQQGISFGTDTALPIGDGNWLVGVTAGYSKSDLNLVRGSSATVDSYHIGAYTTWADPITGYYFDGVVRLNRFDNNAEVRLSDGGKAKGDYQNLGVGTSLEFGRHIAWSNGYFVEPYAQVAGLVVEGKDYTLDNGMRAEGGRTHSLQAKAGTTVGRTFGTADGGMIQPYLRVAAVHEFADGNQVKVNGITFSNNLSGTRGEAGIGVAAAWADKWSGHAEFDYSNGSKLEQPWGVNLGVRYTW